MWTLGQGCLGVLIFRTVVTTDHLLTLNKRTRSNKALVCRTSGSGQNSAFMYFHFFVFVGFQNCRLRFHVQFWREGMGSLVPCFSVMFPHLFEVVIYGRHYFPFSTTETCPAWFVQKLLPQSAVSLIVSVVYATIDHVFWWQCSRGGDGLS